MLTLQVGDPSIAGDSLHLAAWMALLSKCCEHTFMNCNQREGCVPLVDIRAKGQILSCNDLY